MVYGTSYDYTVTKLIRGDEVDEKHSLFKRVDLAGTELPSKSREVRAQITKLLETTHSREHVVESDKVQITLKSITRFIPQKRVEIETAIWSPGRPGRPPKQTNS